jgi:predicted nuclease of predicted toxin-antitoxin system
MNLLVDANLPFKLVVLLIKKGYNVIHTDDMPNKERTTDKEIKKFSANNSSIIITKDSDFFDSHIIQNIPTKLLFVSTGNIVNQKLLFIFDQHFDKIVALFANYDLVELSSEQIIVHEK